MHVKNGCKDLKRYPQISRRVRDTLARLQCAGWPACSTATGQQMHAYAPHAKSFSSQSKNLVKGLGQAHSTARAEQTETYTQHI